MTNNKTKKEYINNLDEIRRDLGKTQEDMAEILNVSSRMYGNYERGIKSLPIEKAKLIAQKYNYSIDYIYKMVDKEKNTDRFMTDIRNIISYKDNKISVKISDSYGQYLYKKRLIEKSNDTTQDKKNRIAELDSQFTTENNDIIWQAEFQISKDNFLSYIESDDKKIPYYFEDSKENRLEVSAEKVHEVKNFFSQLLSNTVEGE